MTDVSQLRWWRLSFRNLSRSEVTGFAPVCLLCFRWAEREFAVDCWWLTRSFLILNPVNDGLASEDRSAGNPCWFWTLMSESPGHLRGWNIKQLIKSLISSAVVCTDRCFPKAVQTVPAASGFGLKNAWWFQEALLASQIHPTNPVKTRFNLHKHWGERISEMNTVWPQPPLHIDKIHYSRL